MEQISSRVISRSGEKVPSPVEKAIPEENENPLVTVKVFREGDTAKITVKDNRILSAVLYGDVQEGGWFFELIQNQQDISAIKDKLLFGKAFCEELLAGWSDW